MATGDFLEQIRKLSPKQLTLLALELREKVERLSQKQAEPIAIVGLGCRLPGGVDTPERYWELLASGVDAITEIPRERWNNEDYYDPDPDAPGKIATRWGGFLSEIDRFDPDFFGIAPREANNMDPQQRLVLEVAWEALERAGHSPASLQGSRTGVFLGICNGDYFQLNAAGDPKRIDAYLASGSAASVASGRLSYLLGLQGPSVSIDTACSSSLVAIHLACQSLRSGESTMAIAGGVNAILRPEVTITLSRAHMMASDGRCKAFDSRADGFVRAEGCGLVVLKRLADAQADGDTIFAVIRSSAANQDGRSSGLTAPNGPSQEAVIRDALASAGLKPSDIDYVEAHGTGTSLGDPIEIQALGAALGPGRAADAPLKVGSVKTNIGHLESAAGVAGLIKVVLALRARAIPPHLHLQRLNPQVDWPSLPVVIPTQLTPWTTRGVRRAGVSSFGFSGTNAHIILEEAPATPAAPSADKLPFVVPVSARSEQALINVSRSYAETVRNEKNLNLADFAFTAGVGRSHQDHRLAIVAADRASLLKQLESAAGGSRAADAPEVVFLFSGQGAQYVGMGRALYDTEPEFRRVIDECEAAVASIVPQPLTQILFHSDHAVLEQTANLQPALFALEVALAALWRSWGIEPSVVMGHSLGEYAAACVARMFSVADGARLVAHRGRLMQSMQGSGGMAAVTADEATVRRLLEGHRNVSIAAVNAPEQVVISGLAPEFHGVTEKLATAGLPTQPLEVSHAFHSVQMDGMLDAFEAEARKVTYHEPRIEVISNVTGEPIGKFSGSDDAARYWRRHVREPVQFARGMAALGRRACRVFLELGPSPVLINMGRRSVSLPDAQWLPSLRRGRDERDQISDTVGRLYVAGSNIDWRKFASPAARRRIPLPTYAFERRRVWLTHTPAASRATQSPAAAPGVNPLLGTRLDVASPTFETQLSLQRFPYLGEHRVGGRAVVPGALMLEMVRATGAAVLGGDRVCVDGIQFREMLVIPAEGSQRVQVAFKKTDAGVLGVTIYSRASNEEGSDWTQHAEGRVSTVAQDGQQRSLTDARNACPDRIAIDNFYSQLAARGIRFGKSFQGVSEAWGGSSCALGRVLLPSSARHEGQTSAPYGAHPALLDAALQVVGVALMRSGREDTFMQVSLKRLSLRSPLPLEIWSFATLRDVADSEDPSADVQLYDAAGTHVGTLEGVGLARISPDRLIEAGPQADWLYEVVWKSDVRQRQPQVQSDPTSIGAELRSGLPELVKTHGLSAYDELFPRMEAAAALFTARAMRKMGFDPHTGERYTARQLLSRCAVPLAFVRLFTRMLAILVEDGVLASVGEDEFEVRTRLPDGDPAGEFDRLREEFPAFRAEIDLLRRCGEGLAEVVRGEKDPLQILFPAGDTAALESLYLHSPSAKVHNEVVRRAIERLVAGAGGRALRVLEIGAGTGATTHHALQALPDGTEYVFTDISQAFLTRASRTFAGRRGFSCKLLDIDTRSLEEQGFEPESFDIIVAANVLHATHDLRRTTDKVLRLLRPGGSLVLLEGTHPLRSVDLTFGMTEGWWRFTDRDLRPSHPLLPPAQWRALLTRVGFGSVEPIPEGPGPAGQNVFVARKDTSAAPSAQSVPQRARWLICASRVEHVNAIAAACARNGIETALVTRSATSSADIEGFDPTVVLFVATHAPAQSGTDAAVADCLAATDWLKRVPALSRSARLWLLTHDAQPVDGRVPVKFHQSALWGWGRVASLESPDAMGGIIDVSADDPTWPQQVCEAIVSAGAEDQLGLKGGERFLPRLHRTSLPAGTWACSPDRSYFVTGWMGGLGQLLVQWLADRGAKHLTLVGRRVPDAGAERLLERLRASGVALATVTADLTDIDALRAAVTPAGAPLLAGVFHLAADMSAGVIESLNDVTYRSMLSAKAAAAWALHELTAQMQLDCFVLFSSTTSLWGVKGLAHYAAANQILDSLAHWRRGQNLPALAVNWGTWDVMRLASTEQRASFESAGLLPMDVANAFGVLERLLAAGRTQAAVAAIDWDVFKTVYEARRARPFFSDIVVPKRTALSGDDSTTNEVWDYAQVALPARAEWLTDRIREEVALVLGLPDAQQIDLTRGLFEMGMDSLMAVELRARLEKRAGRPLPSTLTFNYPNVTALASFFEQQFGVGDSVAPVAAAPTPVAATPVSIQALNPDELTEEDMERLLAERLQSL